MKASDSDVSVEVKHGECSLSEKDYETLSDILSDTCDSEAENSEDPYCTQSKNTDSTSKTFKER